MSVIRIPPEASRLLSSRGMVWVTGTLNNVSFESPLEPDGKGSHFLILNSDIQLRGGLSLGDIVKLEFEQTENWQEPDCPEELITSLESEPYLSKIWSSLTIKARWEWIRWIRSSRHPSTRRKRITTTLTKLQKGLKRPCCFNSSACSIPELSQSGRLMDD